MQKIMRRQVRTSGDIWCPGLSLAVRIRRGVRARRSHEGAEKTGFLDAAS
jgi:hypothetical protein